MICYNFKILGRSIKMSVCVCLHDKYNATCKSIKSGEFHYDVSTITTRTLLVFLFCFVVVVVFLFCFVVVVVFLFCFVYMMNIMRSVKVLIFRVWIWRVSL